VKTVGPKIHLNDSKSSKFLSYVNSVPNLHWISTLHIIFTHICIIYVYYIKHVYKLWWISATPGHICLPKRSMSTYRYIGLTCTSLQQSSQIMSTYLTNFRIASPYRLDRSPWISLVRMARCSSPNTSGSETIRSRHASRPIREFVRAWRATLF